LHGGKVKQIVGSSLRDDGAGLATNFVSQKPPRYYAELYHRDGLKGAHVIMLGSGNEEAAREALAAAPGELQIGGGITPANAAQWLEAGAAQVIVTSWLFENGEFSLRRLEEICRAVPRERLVLDLSCRPVDGRYVVACDRWQHLTSLQLDEKTFNELAGVCCEFLIHAVAVEGCQSGIDRRLVELLAAECPLPCTYAGGIHSMEDIRIIGETGQGKIDFTVGSALDIFGGTALKYDELKAFA
jgi:phosphoribosylformimino-5-aminoimidazole carboxamide ribotide isomerase